MTETTSKRGSLCGELRSKRWFFLDGPPASAEDLLDGSNDCWCARTQMKVGPDDGLVDPQDCDASRSCFRPFGPRV